MPIVKVTRMQSLRGNPICRVCGANIRKLFRKGRAVYSKTAGKRRNKFYCGKCRSEIFEGVKLRDEV